MKIHISTDIIKLAIEKIFIPSISNNKSLFQLDIKIIMINTHCIIEAKINFDLVMCIFFKSLATMKIVTDT